MDSAVARRGRLRRLYTASIGAKMVMAVTGLLLFGFLVAHLLGNLLILQGREAMNDYARFLESKPAVVWPARIVLLLAFALHVATAFRLWRANRAARPEPYRHEATVQATMASRTMILSGLVVGAFVVYHLLHFTFHAVPTGEISVVGGRRDVYGMVVTAFSSPAVALSYVVAQVLLGFHLIHGSRSLFQTLGWKHDAVNPAIRLVAPALTIFIVAGNIFIPLAVLTGLVR